MKGKRKRRLRLSEREFLSVCRLVEKYGGIRPGVIHDMLEKVRGHVIKNSKGEDVPVTKTFEFRSVSYLALNNNRTAIRYFEKQNPLLQIRRKRSGHLSAVDLSNKYHCRASNALKILRKLKNKFTINAKGRKIPVVVEVRSQKRCLALNKNPAARAYLEEKYPQLVNKKLPGMMVKSDIAKHYHTTTETAEVILKSFLKTTVTDANGNELPVVAWVRCPMRSLALKEYPEAIQAFEERIKAYKAIRPHGGRYPRKAELEFFNHLIGKKK